MSAGEAEVTVGVPVFNAEERIGQCLDSLLSQTFEKLAIVVSDNGSTDGTFAIATDYAASDPRITVRRQPANRGMVANYASVLATASSPYFLWRADDDHMGPDYIQRLHDVLSEHPDHYLAVPNIRVDREADGSKTATPVPHSVLAPSQQGIQRIVELMGDVHPSWFYGLWRTGHAQRAYFAAACHFGQVHAHDLLLLLSPILDNAIIGAPDVTFIQHVDSRGRKKASGPRSFAQRIRVREQAWLPFQNTVEALLDERQFEPAELQRLRPSLRAFCERYVGCTQGRFTFWQLRKLLGV